MTTATKTRKTTTTRATRSKAGAASFDRDAMLALRDDALNTVLLEAADLPAMSAALKRLLEIRVRMHLQRQVEQVFDKFEVRFEDRNCRGSAYGTLYLTLSFVPELKNHPVWLSESDLLDGLPKFTSFNGGYSQSLFKAEREALSGAFDISLSPEVGKARFVMFELTAQQLSTAASAWRSTRDAMVAQEQARVSRGATPAAKVLKELSELEARHAELTRELEELDEQLSSARARAREVGQSLERKVTEAKPPLLQHLNQVRAQLGLKAV